MTAYVCGFLRDQTDSVLLVRKLKPKWQAGCLNGIGGKIEADEIPIAAMVREWKEETGTEHAAWREFCILQGGDYKVHFFEATLETTFEDAFPRFENDLPKNHIGEQLEFVTVTGAVKDKTVQNLAWLLPLAFNDTSKPFAFVSDLGVVAPAAATSKAA